MTKQRLLLAKHLEFEAAAAQVRDGRRSIVKTPRGVKCNMLSHRLAKAGDNKVL